MVAWVLLCNSVVTIVTCLACIVKCCKNPIGIGRGFSPQLGQRCFSRKNTVFILLIFCLYPLLSHFWIHCKHPVQTVLKVVFINSRKSTNTIHPLLCLCIVKSNTVLIWDLALDAHELFERRSEWESERPRAS